MRDLETAILRQASALDTPAPAVARPVISKAVPVPAQLPSAAHDFAGRGIELASLNAILAATGRTGQALELFAKAGNHTGLAQTHLSFAWVAGAQGRHEEALGHSRQSLRHDQAAGRPGGQARAAHQAWTDALTILSQLDHPDADQIRAKLRPAVTSSG